MEGDKPVFLKDAAEEDEANGWFENGTVLHELTLEEIAGWIEMHYGLKVINLAGKTNADRKYEIQMEKDASVRDMMGILNLILKYNHIELTLKDSTITMVPLSNH